MNNKKQSPSPKGNHQKQVNTSTSRFNETERLTLEFILKYPNCNRWDLGAYIETGYAPDIIQHIRKKGIGIKTTIVPYTKRSGKKTHIGLYSIKANSLEKARLAVTSD